MMKMLTLFGRDLSELKYNDLKREERTQKFLLKIVKLALKRELYFRESKRITQISNDKVAFLEIYINNLQELIKEIEYYLLRRIEPESNHYKGKQRPVYVIREENYAKHKRVMAEDVRLLNLKKKIAKDRTLISWDKDKFMCIATDRGYQTESALINDMAEELGVDRSATQLLVSRGRFSWGQVMCLGVMMEMTPKEFCDTFLPGYFVDQHGEFRASYANIMKPEAKTISIDVGADGRPLDADEEVWFDD